EDPARRLSDLPLLAAAERRELATEDGDPDRRAPAAAGDAAPRAPGGKVPPALWGGRLGAEGRHGRGRRVFARGGAWLPGRPRAWRRAASGAWASSCRWRRSSPRRSSPPWRRGSKRSPRKSGE